MTFVLIAAEDRTGGGLERILVKAAQAQRAQLAKAPLRFPERHASLNGNGELLKDCAKYRLRRQHQKNPFDHVVYVMDARRSWDLVPGAKRPEPDQPGAGLAELERLVIAHMKAKAKESLEESEWDFLRPGFHAHMLVWERESLILPVLSHFGLGPDIPDVLREQHATERVIERARPSGYGYSKPDAGARFLNVIANDAVLRDKVIQSNPSLQRIIQTLVDL